MTLEIKISLVIHFFKYLLDCGGLSTTVAIFDPEDRLAVHTCTPSVVYDPIHAPIVTYCDPYEDEFTDSLPYDFPGCGTWTGPGQEEGTSEEKTYLNFAITSYHSENAKLNVNNCNGPNRNPNEIFFIGPEQGPWQAEVICLEPEEWWPVPIEIN